MLLSFSYTLLYAFSFFKNSLVFFLLIPSFTFSFIFLYFPFTFPLFFPLFSYLCFFLCFLLFFILFLVFTSSFILSCSYFLSISCSFHPLKCSFFRSFPSSFFFEPLALTHSSILSYEKRKSVSLNFPYVPHHLFFL